MFNFKDHPHRRFNPLTSEWLLVSPHRARRPWLGQQEVPPPDHWPAYDPTCYLCPGNPRAGGLRNPDYPATYVFENDFPALIPDSPPGSLNQEDLIVAEGETGRCRVICFSPRHDLGLSRMDVTAIQAVVGVWAEEFASLAADPEIHSVQIFENRGAMMGCSNPHPHCQIWASRSLPNEVAKETRAFHHYRETHGGCLLCRYADLESRRGERIVLENDHFLVLVPFWAIWPFETLLLSKTHLDGLDRLDVPQQTALAEILKRLTARYDNLFRTSFPYSMGFHQRPTDGKKYLDWHLHAHFYPPLLRSATVRKFMVGYELLGTPQRDITAETAAEQLRSISDTHFLDP